MIEEREKYIKYRDAELESLQLDINELQKEYLDLMI